MTEYEHYLLRDIDTEKVYYLPVCRVCGTGDKTLIWGYTCERNSFHVYIKDKILHLYVYDHNGKTLEFMRWDKYDEVDPRRLVPNKRIYPEACNYEFCRLLVEGYKVSISATTFNPLRPKEIFYGDVK